MNQRVLTPGLQLSILLLSLLMMAGGATFLSCPPAVAGGLSTLAAPIAMAPGAWNSLVTILCTFALCGLLFLINKRYGLLKTGQPFWFFLTLPILSTFLPASAFFSASPVVMGVMLIVLIALYESYKSRNATRNVFFAASVLSIASFWQYGVLLFIPAIIIALFAVHVARIREFMALLMGLAVPYWIALAFGTAWDPDYYKCFQWPQMHSMLVEGLPPSLFPLAVTVGIMMLTALLLTLYNGMKLYAGNSQIRNYNNVINLFGLTAAIGLIMDTGNFQTYCGVFAMWAAIQLGNLFTLWPLRYPRFLLWTILTLLLASTLSQLLYLHP